MTESSFKKPVNAKNIKKIQKHLKKHLKGKQKNPFGVPTKAVTKCIKMLSNILHFA